MEIELLQSPEEWSKVRKLMADVPMSSSVPLIFARSGAPDQAYPSIGGQNILLTIKENGQILAFLRGFLHTRRVDKKEVKFIYLGDVRVAPGWQGKGLTLKLAYKLKDVIVDTGCRQGYFLVNQGNSPIERILLKVPGLTTREMTRHKTASFLIAKKAMTLEPPPYVQFTPTAMDFDAYLEGLRHYYLAPAWSGEEFAKFHKIYPEIRFYRRTDTRESTIAFALWNQSRIKQLSVGRYTPTIRLIRSSWNLVSRFTGAPFFPDLGNPWQQMEICFFNPLAFQANSPKLSLSTIDQFASSEAWDMGCHLVNRIYTGLHQKSWTPSGFYYQSTAHLIVFGFDGEKPLENATKAPVFVDLALI